jgi:hypothetical protein
VTKAARNACDGQSLGLEPRGYFGDVGGGEAELGGVLVWSQPLMIERRLRVLLGGEQGVERGALGGRHVEAQGDRGQGAIGGRGTQVDGGQGAGGDGMGERHARRGGSDGLGDAILGRGGREAQNESGQGGEDGG